VHSHELRSRHAWRVAIPADTALPLPQGALGKALLAFAPDDILDEALASEGGDDRAGFDPERFRAEIADIITTGVARSTGEGMSGSVAIAVPIFREDGIVEGIRLRGPGSRC